MFRISTVTFNTFQVLWTGSSWTYTEWFETNTLWNWTLVSWLTAVPNFQADSWGTGSSNTWPSAASIGTYYVYAETSDPNNSYATFWMETSNFRKAQSISFDYHMYWDSIGTMAMQTLFEGTRTDRWTLSWTQQSDELDAYISSWTIDLSEYFVEKIRFFYTWGSSFTWDAALDNISIISI